MSHISTETPAATESKRASTRVDFVIRLQIAGTPADVARHRAALMALAEVMTVQAEEGLWTLGHADAETDGGESEFVAEIDSTRVQSVLIDGELTYQLPERDAAWRKLADYFTKLAEQRAEEGTSVQLACLVLGRHCERQWLGKSGGPTPEMVALAENTAGEYLEERITAELAKSGTI